MKLIYLFLTLIFCISCISENKDTMLGLSKENRDKEINEVKLQRELLHCDSIIWGVKLVAKVGKNIIMQAKSGDPVFWVYTLNKDTLIENGGFLKNGEGPYEMIYPGAFYDEKRNKLFVCDFAAGIRSMYGIDLYDIANLYDTSTWERFPMPEIKSSCLGPSVFMMNENRLLMLGSHFHSKNLYSYIDFSQNKFCEEI